MPEAPNFNVDTEGANLDLQRLRAAQDWINLYENMLGAKVFPRQLDYSGDDLEKRGKSLTLEEFIDLRERTTMSNTDYFKAYSQIKAIDALLKKG